MHIADALLSPPVALTAGAVAAGLLVTAGVKVKKDRRENLVPLMGVLGAFIFAAQMLNFSIPGTGSSGHIVGGVLLAAFLGPWAAFITLSSVLFIQCLIFADGGLMALGCNILNMAALSTLVAYPLIFRPLCRFPASGRRIAAASLLACVGALELGAVAVVAETKLSGITLLPAGKFLLLMCPIHLLIGIGEGLATAAILAFIEKTRPDILSEPSAAAASKKKGVRSVVIGFAVAAAVAGGALSFLASSDPDGLEWSIQKIYGSTELPAGNTPVARNAEKIQKGTAIMPDYDNEFSGIVGAAMVVALVWGLSTLVFRRRPKENAIGEISDK